MRVAWVEGNRIRRRIRSLDKDTASVKSLATEFQNIEDKIFDELNRLRQLEESITVLSALGTADQSSKMPGKRNDNPASTSVSFLSKKAGAVAVLGRSRSVIFGKP